MQGRLVTLLQLGRRCHDHIISRLARSRLCACGELSSAMRHPTPACPSAVLSAMGALMLHLSCVLVLSLPWGSQGRCARAHWRILTAAYADPQSALHVNTMSWSVATSRDLPD